MPKCKECGQFIYKGMRKWHSRIHRYYAPPEPQVIAKCEACEEVFTWLPPNFDMMHRNNRTTHQWCGGRIRLQG